IVTVHVHARAVRAVQSLIQLPVKYVETQFECIFQFFVIFSQFNNEVTVAHDQNCALMLSHYHPSCGTANLYTLQGNWLKEFYRNINFKLQEQQGRRDYGQEKIGCGASFLRRAMIS